MGKPILYNRRVKNPIRIQQKFDTESEARAFARTLGSVYCSIILSAENGVKDGIPQGPEKFWVETDEVSSGFTRWWETMVYSGKGNRA